MVPQTAQGVHENPASRGAGNVPGGGAGVVPVLPVGPGDAERQRLTRVVRSLFRHEPALADYVVLHDGVDAGRVAADLAGLGPPPVLVDNPRRGRGVPSYDGLACGLTTAFRVVADRFPGRHAWKIDSDAYVIGPCTARIAARLAADATLGLIGTVDHDCGGTPRDDATRRLADVHRKFLWPVWYFHSRRTISSPYTRSGRRFAEWYRGVDRVGGRRGRYAQGGSYAASASLIAAWRRAGRLDRPEDWLGGPIPEDIGFSIWCVTDGFTLADFNRPGEVFGVKNIGLPLPPAELVARGYGVVHSVKADTWEQELANVAALDALVLKPQMDADKRG